MAKARPEADFRYFSNATALLLVAERDVGPDPPRPIFRGMGHFAGVVLCQAGAKVVSDADIEVRGIETFENIDVFHRMPSIRSRQPRHDEACRAEAGDMCEPMKPGFALRATPRQPSLRWACRAEAGEASEGWWSQAGSNRRPLACHASALPAELWPLNLQQVRLGDAPSSENL